MWTVCFVMRLERSDHAKPVESWPTTQSTFSLNSTRPMKIGSSWCVHMSPYDLTTRPTPSACFARLMKIENSWCVNVSPGEFSKASPKTWFRGRALMVITWALSPPYWRASFDARVSNACEAATCPTKTNFRGNIVPHGRKREEWRVYKLGMK